MSPRHDTEVIICCGVGGVGKTTTAAALAMGHALAGKRVVVLTIDPARRLADALGVSLGNEPEQVALAGVQGTLHALMLDRKGTWDEVVRRYSEDPEHAERLLENRYYKAVSTRLTGSHEYMAIEKLHGLVDSARWDVVVVDTPPTQHALDFLEAPDRIRRILDRRVLKLLTEPSGGFWGMATHRMGRVVRRIAGEQVIADISEFFALFSQLSSGFRDRSMEVRTLLRSSRTSYLLVANASAPTRNDILGFLDVIRSQKMQFSGFIVNRVAKVPRVSSLDGNALPEPPAGTTPAQWQDYLLALEALVDQRVQLAERHRAGARSLSRAGGGSPVWMVPDMADDVRSLKGLAKLAGHLPPGPPALH